MKVAVALLFTMALSLQLSATTIRVPQEQPTIQAGIDAAVDGDTVLVGPGTFNEALIYPARTIVVRSQYGADSTFLNHVGSGFCHIYVQNAGPGSVIQGFTIGQSVSATYPVLVGHNGGSVDNFQVLENRFLGNNSDNIITSYETSSVKCIRNLISGYTGYWSGAAIAALGANCEIRNNTIAGGSHGLAITGENSVIVNNLVVGMEVYAISIPHPTSMVDYNNFWGNGSNGSPGPNGISADPQFWLPESDFHLAPTSPCINAGDPNPTYSDPDSTRGDIGCFYRRSIGWQLIVPSQYSTIQSAWNAAMDDDTVLVLTGTYSENLVLPWKRVLLAGSGGMDSVVLHPLNPQVPILTSQPSCESLYGCGSGTLVIRGMTFANCTGATAVSLGLGDAQVGSIENCRFQANKQGVTAGGYASVIGCEFLGNTGPGVSGIEITNNCDFVNCTISDIVVAGNLFASNTGSAVLLLEYHFSTGDVFGNLFMNNVVSSFVSTVDFEYQSLGGNVWINNTVGGGFVHRSDSRTELAVGGNSLIQNEVLSGAGKALSIGWHNVSLNCNLCIENSGCIGIDIYESIILDAHCNNSWGNTLGNYAGFLPDSSDISSNPLLCNIPAGDYRIRNSSPCAPANNSCGVTIGAYGVGCENVAPEITSVARVETTRETPFLYRATSTDPDGPALFYYFSNLPDWLTSQGDSVFGTPVLDDTDTSFEAVVSDGFLSDTQLVVVTLLDPPYVGPTWYISSEGNDSLGNGSPQQPFSSIQRGIDRAVDGDTVLVDDGVYHERISFLGKKITVASHYLIDADTMRIYQTIIDGDTLVNPIVNDTGCVVRFVTGEDSSSVLLGFTVTGGAGAGCGGGIYCSNASPVIKGNRVVYNGSDGIEVNAEALIESCLIAFNAGSGVSRRGGEPPRILNCRILSNQVHGIRSTSILGVVQGCHIANNLGNGIRARSSGLVQDCIIENNSGGFGLSAKLSAAEDDTAYTEKDEFAVFQNVIVRNNGFGFEFISGYRSFDNCLIENNESFGIVAIDETFLSITNSVFRKNGRPTGPEGGSLGGAIILRASSTGMDCSNTLFEGNTAEFGGAILQRVNYMSLTNCTFVNNSALRGSAIFQIYSGTTNSIVDSCIFADNQGGSVIYQSQDTDTTTVPGTPRLTFSCTDIFGNEGGDWTDSLAPQLGVNGNISADPLFCDTANGDYHLRNSSPCAPENNECEALMGKYGVACENAAPEITSEDKVTAYEDIPFSYIADFSDLDGPTGLISYLHYPGWLSVDSTELHGAPPNGSTDSSFLVIVSDNFLADSLLVSISYVARNDAPVLPEMDSISVNEGDTLRLHLVATDIDGDALHFTASDLPLNSSFVDSGNGSALFEFSPDYTQAGFFQPAFAVEDDSLAADTLEVSVLVVNTNLAPIFDAVNPQQVFAGLQLQFLVHATDFDHDSLILTAPTLPANATFVDSGNGWGLLTFSPDLSQIGVHATVLYSSDGALEDTLEAQVTVVDSKPTILKITVDVDSLPMHVTNHTPTIAWSYLDPVVLKTQTKFEIAVGTDNDWEFAEMWNPATFISADTFVVYSGAALVDGQTYWLRLRVNNNLAWSNWSELMIRMNSIPPVPTLQSPASGAAATSLQPIFVIFNSTDAELDSMYYFFEVASDSTMAGAHQFVKAQEPGQATSAQIDVPLDEDAKYYWRVRSSDYYEESGFSAVRSFWVNTSNSAPSPFDLTSPVNTFVPPLTTTAPTLQWTQSIDIDPLDQVNYALYLAIDSNFTFVNVIQGISSNLYTPSSALFWGTRYWWKVKSLDLNGGETWSSQVFRFRTMTLGDSDGNGIVNISDVVFLINYIFAGSAAPNPLAAGDANCSGGINISDAVYLIQYIFGGGAPPCEG